MKIKKEALRLQIIYSCLALIDVFLRSTWSCISKADGALLEETSEQGLR
jgi:hypothetical protein